MASSDDGDAVMMIKRSSIQGYPIKDACSNTEFIAMTTFDGCVFTCDRVDDSKPENFVKVIFPTSQEKKEPDANIVNVCCGGYHFLALSHDGRVYSWGKNTVGQLGIPQKKMKHKKQNQTTQDLKPRLITGLSDYDVIQIACGDDHSLALTRDGRLFSWGCNRHGQLGVETKGQAKRAKHHVEKPTEIKGLLGVPLKHITAGGAHSIALSTSGSVFVWGRNAHGQLGLQELDDVKLPVKLGSMSQWNVKDVSCGSHHTSFLIENGKLLVYGMGIDRYPCESDDWRETELRPGDPDRFRTFSHLQCTSRCTYAVDEFTGGIFVLRHDTVGQGVQSGNLHFVSLEEGSIIDLFESVSQTDWPPGRYNFDPNVWCWSDDTGDEDFIDCMDDAYSDNDSFVTCDDDYVSTVSDDFPVDHEVRAALIAEQEDMSRNHADSVETSPVDISALAQINHTSPEERRPSSNESLSGRNASCSGIERAPKDTDSTAAELKSLPSQHMLPQSDTTSMERTASITGDHDCPGEGTSVDESSAVIVQENNQRPPRTWRRMCTGLENIFIVEHEEPVGEEAHIAITSRREIDTISAELLQSLNVMKGKFTKESPLFQLASMVFSSPACINASFRQTGPNEVNGLNVDLKAARRAFELISKNNKLLERLSEVITVYLCSRIPQSTPHEEALRFYLILMECPIFSDPSRAWSRKVLAALGRLMGFFCNTSTDGELHLNSAALARWWRFEPMSFRHTIMTYRLALTFLINDMTLLEKEVENFWTYLKVLRSLNEINIQHDIQSVFTFHIPNLDKVAFKPPYPTYGRKHPLESFQKFSWLSYPFVIDLELKAKILANTNRINQANATLEEIFQHAWFEFLRPWYRRPKPLPSMFLHLIVSRDNVFGSTVRKQLAEMLRFPRCTLQKPLTVEFKGESGVDAGAPSMDFFRLVFEELLDPEKNDLFRYIDSHDSTHSSVWFRKDCCDSEVAEICGLLLGLLLYNKAIIPLPFPQLLYAKLLGKGPKSEIEEAAELDKEFTDQISKLLIGSEEYVMGCCYGEEIGLEDGRSIEVTKENVHLFVQQRLREYLVPSQFAAFQQGFERVHNPAIFKLFRPIELEALVTGEKIFDWKALEQSTRYIQPYRDSHSTIRIFWEVFHALDDDMKRKFLVFVSGSDRVPVGGLRNFGLHIDHLHVPMDDDESCSVEERLSRLLPQGHGCDNHGYRRTLRLPMYNSLELMEDRLTVALSYYDCPFHIA